MKQRDYDKQINKVIDYINKNISKELTVQTLLALVDYSPYHFHRIFTSQMGESLAKYVLRRRLELAAIRLTNSENTPIMNIAYDVGFSSVNVFCRNFKRRFGVTAEEFRSKNHQQNSKNSTFKHKNNPFDRVYNHYFCSRKSFLIENKKMEKMDCKFEIKKMPALHIAYCRHHGAYDKMSNAFVKLMQWAHTKELINGSSKVTLLSVYHSDPNITNDETKLTSDAGIIIDPSVKTDGEIGSYDLAEGLYAVGRFEILFEEFPVAWKCMNQLISEYECQHAEGVPYELYHNNVEEHPERKWIIDICMPIRGKN